MAEDLVCKFPRCISVGSWRDPWRINGPALMKGRGRGGWEQVGENRCLSHSLNPLCISLSLSSTPKEDRLVVSSFDPLGSTERTAK